MERGARRNSLIGRATSRVGAAAAAALVVLVAGEALAQVAARARTGSGAGSVSVQVGGAVGGGSVTHTVRGGGVWYGPPLSGYGGTYRHVVYGRDGYPSAETGPYRYVTPWPRVINGVPAYAHGYPPHYGPRSRLSPGYSVWPWGPYAVYFANEFDTPVYETSRRVDPAIANAPANRGAAAAAASAATVVEAPRDLGAEALRERDYPRAIAVYARRAQEQRDAEASGTVSADATATGAAWSASVDRTAQRLLAVALVGDRRPAEAQAAMAAAYREDAALAGTRAEEGLIDASEWRRITNVAVAHAHEARSEAAWLLVARLMEMQGRGAVAKTMFERAAATARGDSRPELINGARPTPEATKPSEPAKRPGPASFRMPRPGTPG